ncbi:MAG: hypothetical protein NVSMB21_02090 [Vulcanimicrobiaceae bacterium]
MTLAPHDVVALQHFLMDAAKRYAALGVNDIHTGEPLASAAALDYVLLIASQRPAELSDATSETARSSRATMARAARAALDVVACVIAAPSETFTDFADRQLRPGGIFETLETLRKDDVVRTDDVVFRSLTLTHDIAMRRASL